MDERVTGTEKFFILFLVFWFFGFLVFWFFGFLVLVFITP